jgi:hypothetical protein
VREAAGYIGGGDGGAGKDVAALVVHRAGDRGGRLRDRAHGKKQQNCKDCEGTKHRRISYVLLLR